MLRPELLEAYARRLIAALGAELRANVSACSYRVIDHPGENGGEWTALLETGSRIRLQAVIQTADDDGLPIEPTAEDLQDQVRLVAEGVTSCNEQLKQQREDLTRRIDAVESFNRLSYQDLDVRVRRLEKTA